MRESSALFVAIVLCIVIRKVNIQHYRNRNNGSMSKGVAHIAHIAVFRFQVELMELFVKFLDGWNNFCRSRSLDARRDVFNDHLGVERS